MITFDEKTKTLIGQKCPDADIEIDPVTPHLESYKKYYTETIYSDVQDLARIIETTCGIKGVEITANVIDNNQCLQEIKNTKSGYYSVSITITHQGVVNANIPLLTLPYQDCYGVYTFPDGSRQALYSELTNLEELSIDREKKLLNIVLPKRAFTIKKENVVTNGFSFKIYGKSLGFQKIIKHFANMEEVELPNLKDYFANANIMMALTDDANLMPVTVQKEDAKVNFFNTMKSDSYKLGRLRRALNERLVIDYCLNKVLSRPVYLRFSGEEISAGTLVTRQILDLFKRNLVNEVYCVAEPKIEGSSLQRALIIDKLKAGTEITPLLKDYLDKAGIKVNSSFLEEDVNIPITFKAETKLTSEMIKLFADSGINKLYIKRPGTDNDPILISFEQEYIGNRTTKMKYLFNPEDMPAGYSAEDYVYFDEYGVPAENYDCPDNITTYDLLALVSYFSRNINDEDAREVVNRDYDFLKKINMANEILSNVFYRAATAFVAKYRDKIREALAVANEATCRSRFIGFKDMWKKTLNDTKLLRLSMDVNTLTMYSQTLRAVVPVKSDRHVSKNMRMLTLFHDGRFCHYDSPAGRKIGLVCTLTLGCRIEDGLLKVPKRHIQNNRLTSDVKYFTPEEELEFISSDALNMKIVDGVIQDTQVPARIPSVTDEENRIRIGNVSSTQVEYVNAFAEQNMSPTPAAVPFAGADDSARLGFSVNLQNQTKCLVYSEEPLVYTSIYKQIYDIPNDYVIRAEADGVVQGIYKNYIVVDYKETRYKETIYVDEVSDALLTKWASFPKFKAGDMISEKPMKRAKYSGYITNFDSNKVEYEYIIEGGQKQVKIRETKLLNETVMTMNIKVKAGDIVSRGDILVDTPISRNGIYSPGLNVFTVFIANDGYNYEDAVNMDEDFAQMNTSISVHKEETKLKVDKYSALVDKSKINTYIRKGDTISVIDRTSSTDLTDKHPQRWKSSKHEGLLYSIEKCKDNYVSDKTIKRYEAKIIGFNSVTEADKMAGRHGNKGVTGRVFKTSEMPMAKNGKVFNLALNPHGVASRMNLGQILELLAGLNAYLTGVKIQSNAFNGLSTYEVFVLVKFAHHCCNVYDMSKESDIRRAIDEFGSVLPESYIRYAATRHEIYKEWEGVFDEHGLAEIYDPNTNTYLRKKGVIGFSYFLKIKQEVESKMHVRGGLLEDEPYSAKTYSPLQGASNHGGQANGEMEIMALLAHSANYLAYEYTSTKADNYGRRFNLLSEAIGHKKVFSDEECLNRATMVFEYYGEVLGAKMECSELPELTQQFISKLRRYDRTHIADAFLAARKRKAQEYNRSKLPSGKITGAQVEADIIGAQDAAVMRDIERLGHSKTMLEAEDSGLGINTGIELDLDSLDLGGDEE